MNKIIIFCESYPQIKNALSIISDRLVDNEITLVITSYPGLFQFFGIINNKVFQNKVRLLYLENYRGNNNIFLKTIGFFSSIIKERRYWTATFNNYFAVLRDIDIYFFGRCFNPATYFILKKLSPKNKLIYMSDPSYDVLSLNKTIPKNIAELAYFIKFKLTYSADIELVKFPYLRSIPNIPDKFFTDGVYTIIDKTTRDTLLQKLDIERFRVFESGDYNVIFFHQNLIKDGYVSDVTRFTSMLNGVFKILIKYFDDAKIAQKYHPSGRDEVEVTRLGKVLPDFIPAEFIYSEKVKLYIGLYSIALANIEKGLVVSLLEMIDFRDDRYKTRLKSELLQWSHSEILFPRSLVEFENIVKLVNTKNA